MLMMFKKYFLNSVYIKSWQIKSILEQKSSWNRRRHNNMDYTHTQYMLYVYAL